MQQADLIIALGARFDDRITGRLEDFAKKSKKIHVDIDPTSIEKNVLVDVGILGDAKDVEFDRENRPSRPIPRGILSRTFVWVAGGMMMVLGLVGFALIAANLMTVATSSLLLFL